MLINATWRYHKSLTNTVHGGCWSVTDPRDGYIAGGTQENAKPKCFPECHNFIIQASLPWAEDVTSLQERPCALLPYSAATTPRGLGAGLQRWFYYTLCILFFILVTRSRQSFSTKYPEAWHALYEALILTIGLPIYGGDLDNAVTGDTVSWDALAEMLSGQITRWPDQRGHIHPWIHHCCHQTRKTHLAWTCLLYANIYDIVSQVFS